MPNNITVPEGYTCLFANVYIKETEREKVTTFYMAQLSKLLKEESISPRVYFVKKVSDNPSIVPLPGGDSYQIV